MIQNRLPHDHGQTIEHELECMPSVENFQTVADIFKHLGDGSRTPSSRCLRKTHNMPFYLKYSVKNALSFSNGMMSI